MKTTTRLIIAMMFAGLLAFTSSCTKDNGGSAQNEIPQAVKAAFESMFPDAVSVNWSMRDGFAVARFRIAENISAVSALSAVSAERNTVAWFLMSDASWKMTETEITFNELPSAVRDAFAQTEYASAPWTVDDDVDVLVRENAETVYVIDAEKNEGGTETNVELYYSEDGILVHETVKTEKDDDHYDMLPEKPSAGVSSWLEEHFPGARIVDYDEEDGTVEVEFIYEGRKHEAVFDHSGNWLYTKTDLRRSDLDSIDSQVLSTLRENPDYTGDGDIDDIERYESRDAGIFYCFELDARRDDVEIYIAADGTLLDGKPSLGDEGLVSVEPEIRQFISERYPSAVILDRESDHGYVEVEIRDGNIEKTVLFNGRLEWVMTAWEIRYADVPEAVRNAMEAAGYKAGQIDDEASVVEKSDSTVYMMEVEKGDNEVIVSVNEDGTGLKEIPEID